MPAASPDPTRYASLLDLLEGAAERHGDRRLVALRTDEGPGFAWSAREVVARSRLVAWRLRELGLEPGDRLLTWSPSSPELAAVYFGAMRAGVVLVPLDLRMAPDVVRRIAERAETAFLALGTGRDAPDPRSVGLGAFRTRTVPSLVADPPHQRAEGPSARRDEGSLDVEFPDDWERLVDAWPRPARDDLFEIVFTSGTTGHPKGVMLTHGNILSTLEATRAVIPPWDHRLVSILPLSHLFGWIELLLVFFVGAELLYIRSNSPRVIFQALREHRVTTMLVVPQLLEIFWSAIGREVAKRGASGRFERARRVARWLPYALRRRLFRSLHEQLGGSLRLFVSSAAFLPPSLQEAWQGLGVVVMQGYGATECGFATAQSVDDHPIGTVGRSAPPVELRLADDGEIVVGGPTVFRGYWRDPEATAQALDADGAYRTGDVGRLDRRGHLVLTGRKKNMIVLPNGLNVFPEDIENALEAAGLRGTVVVETQPGRIETVVLATDERAAPGGGPLAAGPATERAGEPEVDEARRREVEAAIRTANAALGIHQRVQGYRFWPGDDFPRTHTFKVRRDLVQAWAASAPAPTAGDATARRGSR